MEEFLRDEFALKGDIIKVTVKTGTAGSGTVRVNGTSLDMEYSPWTDSEGGLTEWTGEYFTDFDIELSAEALSGHHFAVWECSNPLLIGTDAADAAPSSVSSSENVSLLLSDIDTENTDEIVLTAVFE